jgi:hypothetical protein
MRQATLRLRREVAWIWHERGAQDLSQQAGTLPPFIDAASVSLDLSRHWTEKQEFFATDVAAKYLTEQIATDLPETKVPERGSFGWVVNELALDDVSTFVLALSLACSFDGSFGAVVASCLNDPNRIQPNLLLAQRLWDRPEEVLTLSDPMHPLFSYGLLTRGGTTQRNYPDTHFEQPVTVPSLVTSVLLSLGPRDPGWPRLDRPSRRT